MTWAAWRKCTPTELAVRHRAMVGDYPERAVARNGPELHVRLVDGRLATFLTCGAGVAYLSGLIPRADWMEATAVVDVMPDYESGGGI